MLARRQLALAVFPLVAFCATCGGEAGVSTSTAGEGPVGSHGVVTTSSMTTIQTTSSLSTTSTTLSGDGMPVPPPLPPVADYRSLLGRYADMVLNGGLVPYGSVEHVNWLADCIESAGFVVEIDDGGVTARPGVEQAARYREVMALCEQAAVDRGLVGPLLPPDEEELAAWYEASMWTYQCLEAAGFPVPDPVSLDVYVESGGAGWHPYQALGSGPQHEEAEQSCPDDLVVVLEILAAGG